MAPEAAADIVAAAIRVDPLLDAEALGIGAVSGPAIQVGEAQSVELAERTAHREKVNFAGERLELGVVGAHITGGFMLQEAHEVGSDNRPLAMGDDDDRMIAFSGYGMLPTADVAQQRRIPAADARLGIRLAWMLAQPAIDVERDIENVAKAE